MGLLAYLVNNSNEVGGAGHNAIIIGSGNGPYTFMSYGPEHGPFFVDNGLVDKKPFDSLSEAMKYAQSKGYNRYQKFDNKQCNGSKDAAALQVGDDWNNTLYRGEGGHNSNDFASAALRADGFPWLFQAAFPNDSFNNLLDTQGTNPFGPVEQGQITNLLKRLGKN